jgi:hypothetical protein
LILKIARAQIDPQHGEVGHDIVRAATIDPCRLTDSPSRIPAFSRSARSAAGNERIATVGRIAPGMSGPARHGEAEIAAPGSERRRKSVGQREGS